MPRPIITDSLKAFVAENEKRAPSEIALMVNPPEGVCPKFAAQQIKARQRIARKLPSWAASPEVAFPASISLEQCSSEIAARFKASVVAGGASACDLTGGFGVDARFLAERYDRLHYCERDAELAEIAEWNFREFGLADRVAVRCSSALEMLEESGACYDLIYIDPARRDGRSLKVSALEDCEPDVVAHWKKLLECGRTVMLKASPGLDITRAISQLSGVFSVYVVSVKNECKELLLLAKSGHQESPRIHCVNIGETHENLDTLEFSLEEERELEATVGPAGRYLYEPNASIMKAGAFKTLSARTGLSALNPRTRLYGSTERFEGFPGRVFEIVGRGALNPKDAKRLFPARKANVISRNSGMSADELRKKLKLKDGGDLFAIGAAVSGSGRALFACRLVVES